VPTANLIEVPADALSPEALRGVIEAVGTDAGTDPTRHPPGPVGRLRSSV